MNASNLSKIINNVKLTLGKHSPEILTGIGIAGMIGTTIMAVQATPKAMRIIEEQKKEKHCSKLPPLDVVKATWKCYIPAGVTGVTSIACLIGANSINARRNAALATAYSLSRTALSEYKEKVVETIGEKKEQAISEKIAQDKLEKNPVSSNEVVVTEKGNTLCYDSLFGRYFLSDIDAVKRAINAINRKTVVNMYASLNEFYNELGLSNVDIGDELGWKVDDGELEVFLTSKLAEDGRPCLVISYNIAPHYDYSKYY